MKSGVYKLDNVLLYTPSGYWRSESPKKHGKAAGKSAAATGGSHSREEDTVRTTQIAASESRKNGN